MKGKKNNVESMTLRYCFAQKPCGPNARNAGNELTLASEASVCLHDLKDYINCSIFKIVPQSEEP